MDQVNTNQRLPTSQKQMVYFLLEEHHNPYEVVPPRKPHMIQPSLHRKYRRKIQEESSSETHQQNPEWETRQDK